MTTLQGPLVTANWLLEHIDDDGLVIVDVRWYIDGRNAEAVYDAGHLPGAVFVDLDDDLAGTAGPGRHPLPSPEHFAAAMERLGIGDDSTVVVYDDANGSVAARLWWMLSSLGRKVAVLDGGISAWTGELSIDAPSQRHGVTFTPTPWPIEKFIDATGVDYYRRGSERVVLDARSTDRFDGRPNPIDKRLGHIPGAQSAPWTENLDRVTGRFRPVGELRERFTRLGVRADRPAICHCGSGVTACHNLLALTVARLEGGAVLYTGSWSDWSADEQRPADIASE